MTDETLGPWIRRFLLEHVVAVIPLNLGPGTTDHQVLQYTLAGCLCVGLHNLKVSFPIGLPVQTFELLLQRRKECLKISQIRNRAVLAVLKELDLAEYVTRAIIQWCGGN